MFEIEIDRSFSAAHQLRGYNGDCCLEIEDRFFEDGTRERLVQAVELSKRYMDQFVI